jgi:2-polyprenyl-6-methoxyphenol hydroxylase-like FAD-dependent oxidoreductase
MSTVLVIGGSVGGLGVALALADRGHQVTIVERAAEPHPETVAQAADQHRPTVPQAVHSHAFASRCCNLLRERAPDVYDALQAAGCVELNLADRRPPALAGQPEEPHAERLPVLLSRRSTFELVLRQRTLARPNVELLSGWTVRGLLASPDDPSRIIGVQSASGATLTADYVVDASGRRSQAHLWLDELGLPVPPGSTESCRIVYYSRHYRLLAPEPPGPLNRGFGAGAVWNHYAGLLFLADNQTFSITLGALPNDSALKPLRHEAAFTAAIRATPVLAAWITDEAGEPISPVHVMAGLDSSWRLPNPDDQPVTGFFSIGDAICTTNPAYGRGVSLGLSHAMLLADLLTEFPEPSREQATQFGRRSTELLRPWFEDAGTSDRYRAGLWEATLAGQPPPAPPAGTITPGAAAAAAAKDATVWRRLLSVLMMLMPPAALYADPEIAARIGKALADGPPPQPPGASRDELVAAIVGAELESR